MAGVDQYTKLLMHFDDSSFSDKMGHTVTNTGVAVNNSVYKFGAGSGQFNGTSNYLTLPYSTDFEFGSNDFTIECWIYPISLSSYITYFERRTSVTFNSILLSISPSGQIQTNVSMDGSSWVGGGNVVLATGVVANQWNHLVVCRQGTSLYGFVNGIKGTPVTISGSISPSTDPLQIGRYCTGVNYMNGYMDEFRISKGIARWTTNFTPPISPYDKTKFLLHDGDNVSTYKKIKYSDKTIIPVMTSNTTPSGRAICDSIYAPYDVWNVFDGDNSSTFWHCASNNTYPHYVGYEFTSAKIIGKYAIQLRTLNGDDISTAPKTWEFQGSDDGINWVTLDTQTNIIWTTSGQKQYFTFNNITPYIKYRLYITLNNGYANTNVSFGSLEMYEFFPSIDGVICKYPPTENDFLNKGMDDISTLYQQGDLAINETVSNGETLGSGILHKYHVKKSDMWSITGFECKDV